MPPKVTVVSSKEAVAIAAADLLETVLGSIRTLGLATGGTMEPFYGEVLRRVEMGQLDFSGVSAFFNLDEYVGLPPGHPCSYWFEMSERFFGPLDIHDGRRYMPAVVDGESSPYSRSCQAFEDHIRRARGISLQMLGIGEDGHIGFNMPGTSFTTRTHVAELSESTRRANARFFDDDVDAVPTHALTMGIRTIMDANRVVLLATGRHKAEAVRRALEEAPNEDCPASALQTMSRGGVCFILDTEAASLLSEETLSGS